MSVGRKTAIGISIILILNIIFAVFTWKMMNQNARLATQVRGAVSELRFWSALSKDATFNNLGYMDAIVDKDEGSVDADIIATHKNFLEKFAVRKNEALDKLKTAEEKSKWQDLVRKIEVWLQTGDELFETIKKKDSSADYAKFDDVLDGTLDEIVGVTDAYLERIDRESLQDLDLIVKNSQNSEFVTLVGSAVILLLSLIVGIYLGRSVTLSLSAVAKNLSQSSKDWLALPLKALNTVKN